MTAITTLLEIQELDLAADSARARSAGLPERQALPLVAEKRLAIEAEWRAARGEKEADEAREEALAAEVVDLTKAIETSEVERYSGKRFDRDEAAAHDASQQALREKQSVFEEEELEILERLEAIDARIERLQQSFEESQAEVAKLETAIQAVEAEVAGELDRLAREREQLVPGLPVPILTAYERVRAQPRAGGRGATMLAEGQCGGCRIKLPSLEVTKMLAAPDDAVIQCPQCRRVLVRSSKAGGRAFESGAFDLQGRARLRRSDTDDRK